MSTPALWQTRPGELWQGHQVGLHHGKHGGAIGLQQGDVADELDSRPGPALHTPARTAAQWLALRPLPLALRPEKRGAHHALDIGPALVVTGPAFFMLPASSWARARSMLARAKPGWSCRARRSTASASAGRLWCRSAVQNAHRVGVVWCQGYCAAGVGFGAVVIAHPPQHTGQVDVGFP